MNSFIIGTAGHIDHGKTALIQALTSHVGDRLKEEKERGITIDLGFTYFPLENGEKAGIIDVPGHEKFLKNMLSGASSISIVLLVIAANEGIMPQTVEHFNILSFLGIEKALVVLTKSDLAGEETISRREAEIRAYFKGTAYEGIEIYPVSSVTMEGIAELKKRINTVYRELAGRESVQGKFRLSVDRVFNSRGFGTVVTGTVLGGSVKVNDALELLSPAGAQDVRVRGIQVHEEVRQEAQKGQRCALNLARVSKDDIHRGDVLAEKGLLKESYIIDCSMRLVRGFDHELRDRQRVRLYHGTREVLGRIHVIRERTDEESAKDQEQFVQIRLEGKLHALKGDRYVLRNYSPLYLIGGGEILNPEGEKFRQHDRETYRIRQRAPESTDGYDLFISELEHQKGVLQKKALREASALQYLDEGTRSGDLIELAETVMSRNTFLDMERELQVTLSDYFVRYPLREAMKKEEARLKLSIRFSQKDFILLVSMMDAFLLREEHIKFKGRTVSPSQKDLDLAERIRELLGRNPLMPEDPRKLPEATGDRERYHEVINYLKDRGEIMILDELVFLKSAVVQAKQVVIDEIRKSGKIEIRTAREMLGSSRKYVVPILEYLDREMVTKRSGDTRILY